MTTTAGTAAGSIGATAKKRTRRTKQVEPSLREDLQRTLRETKRAVVDASTTGLRRARDKSSEGLERLAASKPAGQARTAIGVAGIAVVRGAARVRPGIQKGAGWAKGVLGGGGARVLHAIGLPQRSELEALQERLDALAAQIADLRKSLGRQSANAVELHVTPGEKGWDLRDGQGRRLEGHPTKRETIEKARRRAEKAGAVRLVIHRADGSIQQEQSFEASGA